jgi:hypothetical protein
VGAPFVFETAKLGETGQVGGLALSDQILGARFHLEAPTQIDEVGGHMLGLPADAQNYGTLFAAIVALSGPTAFPVGDPASLNVLAFTTFTAPFPSQDVLVPLSVSLPPGHYALIFGGKSGLFDSTGNGTMPNNNTEISGNALFLWSIGRTSEWLNGTAGARFVIKGTTSVPN